MAIAVRVFAWVALMCVINAMSIKKQKEASQINLVAVKSVAQSEIEASVNDDLTRIKRNCKFELNRNKYNVDQDSCMTKIENPFIFKHKKTLIFSVKFLD